MEGCGKGYGLGNQTAVDANECRNRGEHRGGDLGRSRQYTSWNLQAGPQRLPQDIIKVTLCLVFSFRTRTNISELMSPSGECCPTKAGAPRSRSGVELTIDHPGTIKETDNKIETEVSFNSKPIK